ncbi:MAG: CinA family nicotinamide mononucleotide deamidase-related protein [Lentisphaeria bacterium]|nr:CinA family nicotinamide mononucleotide deamidase-related protein [Lentisphaeria bacterium]
MKIALICTGTELLKGSCYNTDLAFAGKKLTEAGIPPVLEICVGDHADELVFAMSSALKVADTILLSGGLGPTADDITLETVARFFDLELVIEPELQQKVETLWAQRHGGRCPKHQYKQAMLPVGAKYFANPVGVASGIGIQLDYAGSRRNVFLLPGPPGEFEAVFSSGILPELRKLQDTSYFTAGFFVCGKGETIVAKCAEPLLKDIPVEIAYTAKNGGTGFFLSGEHDTVVNALEKVRSVLGNAALPIGEYSLPEYLIKMLIQRKAALGCAESCTGGMVADSLVSVPGASECFKGGIVAYANEVKELLLQVPADILRDHGAVSPECAEAMARGVCAALKCDCAVSTTGIAGPGGGTPDKPVGLVYVSAVYNGLTAVRELHLRGNRRMIRERAVAQALLLLKELLDGCGEHLC